MAGLIDGIIKGIVKQVDIIIKSIGIIIKGVAVIERVATFPGKRLRHLRLFRCLERCVFDAEDSKDELLSKVDRQSS